MMNTWSFEVSFTVFLAVTFIAQALSAQLRAWVSMPFIFGVLFIAAFKLGIFPADIVPATQMMAVGVIAYHLLIIHGGSMLDIGMLRRYPKPVLICLLSSLAMAAGVGFGLSTLLGRQIALIAPGCVVGGGAAAAIASRWVAIQNPALTILPWLIFMVQGLFSFPVITLAMRAETRLLLAGYRKGESLAARPVIPSQPGRGLAARMPAAMKTTAYYLGGIMLLGLLNSALHSVVLLPAGISISPILTALVLGLLASQLGIMERGPLFKSDAYGLLLLGLMGLMANAFAAPSLESIVALLPALLLVCVVSTLLLSVSGALLAKALGLRAQQGIILAVNCMTGYPVQDRLLQSAQRMGETDAEKAYLRAELQPLLGIGTMIINNALSIGMVSILTAIW